MGSSNRSAIGTLVERTTRYLLILYLPDGHDPEHVRDALVRAVAPLPAGLRRSLTWDQGIEMRRHGEFTAASDVPVYFCERSSPWQRGSNENTHGLLRQYFPKGTDLRVHTAERLAGVAADLNSDRARPSAGRPLPSSSIDCSHRVHECPCCDDRGNPPTFSWPRARRAPVCVSRQPNRPGPSVDPG
jgi:transposase, IS30 family